MCNHYVYTLDLPPTQDASHHQDHEPFLVGNPCKPSFVTVTGWGVDQMYTSIYIYIYMGNVHIKNPGCFFPLQPKQPKGLLLTARMKWSHGACPRDPKTMKTTNVWIVTQPALNGPCDLPFTNRFCLGYNPFMWGSDS